VGPAAGIVEVLSAIPHVVEVAPQDSSQDRHGMIVRCEHRIDVRREIAARVVGAGFALIELRPVVMTLEQIFLSLVGERGDPEAQRAPGSETGEEPLARH
jgi:hypothetical protein